MIIGPIVYDAVELMVRLAVTERPVAVGPLAAELVRSPSYTEGLLALLRSSALVKTVKGRRRAFRLARPAALISAADIFEAVYRARSSPGARRFHPAIPSRDAIVTGMDLLQETLTTHTLIFLRGVRLADLLPHACAGMGSNAFAEPSHSHRG